MFSETQITQQSKRESVLRCSVTDHADNMRRAEGRGRTVQLLPRIVRNRPIRRLFCAPNMGAFAAGGEILR